MKWEAGRKLATEPENPLTQEQCTDQVIRYLAGQGWELAAPRQLAAEIWQSLAGTATKSAVLTEIRRQYTTLLHNHCRQPDSAEHERAWHELKIWLQKNAPRLESHIATRQEIVQETLIAIQGFLSNNPLKKPESLFAFAFQTMRRQHIDFHRRQTAEKRDWRKTIPLENLGKETDTKEDGSNWQEYLSATSGIWRKIENIVSDQEVRQQLLQFAQEHLPTNLQQQVFNAHFLDGLKPAEIARLLGKQPHQIRLVKARVVKKLRSLSRPEREHLLEILGELKNHG